MVFGLQWGKFPWGGKKENVNTCQLMTFVDREEFDSLMPKVRVVPSLEGREVPYFCSD